MSLHHYIDNVEVTVENDPVPGPWETAARGGVIGGSGGDGSGGVTVVDPTGVLDLRGWKTYRADETLCVGRESIFRGFVGGKEVSRGNEGPRGPGRVWTCQIYDGNAQLHFRVLRGSDCKRPAEDNLTRIAWLLAKLQGLGVLIYDTGHVLDSHPRPFEDADYTHKFADDVLSDISGIIGRDYFVFWDYDASGGAKWALWYNQRAASDLVSSLAVTNVAGEANDTTIFSTGAAASSDDAKLTREPDETYSGDDLTYRNGNVYRTNATTASTFIARDNVEDNSRIGLESTAIAAADSYIDAHSTEKDTVIVPVRLPASKVNFAAAGESIGVHLEHLPGYTAGSTTTRISRRAVSKPTIDNFYDVLLTCTLAAPASTGGDGGSSSFPQQPGAPPSVFQTKDSHTSSTLTLDHTPTPGDTMYGFIARRGGGSAFVGSGWTLLGHATGGGSVHPSDLYKRTVVSGDTTVGPVGGSAWWNSGGGDKSWIAEVIGAGTETTVVVNSTYPSSAFSGGSVTNVAGALLLTGGTMGVADNDETKMGSVGAGVTEFSDPSEGGLGNSPWPWGGYMANVAAGTHAVTGTLTSNSATGYSAITVGIAPSGAGTPPAAGKWVYNELVTLTGGAGTTAFPFADGSLKVRYDIIDQTPAIVSYNGVTAGFVMPSQPPLGTQVFVDYQGR